MVADDRYPELQRQVTAIGEAVAGLTTSVRHMADMMREERDNAKQSRKGLYDQMSALRMEQAHENLQITELKGSVATVKDDAGELKSKLDKVETKIKTYDEALMQATGASKVVVTLAKLLYVLGGAGLVGVGWLINTIMSGGHPR